jgi:hypothetical protein
MSMSFIITNAMLPQQEGRNGPKNRKRPQVKNDCHMALTSPLHTLVSIQPD